MRRRQLLAGMVVGGPVLAFRGEALPIRRAQFEEVGDSVAMTLDVPELFPDRDRDALESIDSGFATRITFDVELHRVGSLAAIGSTTTEARIQYDLWGRRYVVATREQGRNVARRYFSTRADALRAAVRMQRVKIARVDALVRGSSGPYYFVVVVAKRNPVVQAPASNEEISGRAQGPDVRWFGRLLDFLADRAPDAEQTVSIRTNPFFLPPR